MNHEFTSFQSHDTVRIMVTRHEARMLLQAIRIGQNSVSEAVRCALEKYAVPKTARKKAK